MELVLSLGFSYVGPERDFPGVLDQRGPNGGGPGKRPRNGPVESRGGVSKGNPTPDFPKGRASAVC